MEKICPDARFLGSKKGHEFKSIGQIEECKSLCSTITSSTPNEKEDIIKQWDAINSKNVLEILEVNRKKIIKETQQHLYRDRKDHKLHQNGLQRVHAMEKFSRIRMEEQLVVRRTEQLGEKHHD
jgi:hypothetical protein